MRSVPAVGGVTRDLPMEDARCTVRTAAKRASCETYLLISLTSFFGSVIATRLFLEPTGYPQLGGGELHIAPAVWGGLLLLAASFLLLILASRRWYLDLPADIEV